MSLTQRAADWAIAKSFSPDLAALLQPLESLLVSGGDNRLALSFPLRENAYGCTPHPQPGLNDFASSTASSISEAAYERVKSVRAALMARSLRDGVETALDGGVETARATLLSTLNLETSGAQAVFAASGTDAQLYGLFLARAILRKPLTVVIAGSDQTGSGTAHTCRGHHFSQATSQGVAVEKGGAIAGLADDVQSLDIAFCDAAGAFRNAAQMDEAVLAAVSAAAQDGRAVLLQAMAASKFGWQAPSQACLDEIAARWPGQVQVIIDACQFRLARREIGNFLAKGYMVLVTGSKFFTGPAFSGALLVPPALSAAIADIRHVPAELALYGSALDWPLIWPHLRAKFRGPANIGQWLRWEAALEEMRLYYAVPRSFRAGLRKTFRAALEDQIARADCLSLMAGGAADPSIFAVMLSDGRRPLPAPECARIYQLLRRGPSQPCQLGQPVPLPAHGTAPLRISLSARLVRQCWSPEKAETARNIEVMLSGLAAAIGKLNGLCRPANEV